MSLDRCGLGVGAKRVCQSSTFDFSLTQVLTRTRFTRNVLLCLITLLMRNRVLSLVLASKSRLGGRLQQRHKPIVHTQLDSTLPMPNISTDRAAENAELTFVEEPLGLRADQGYGYLQVDFGQRIDRSS